MTTEQLLLVMWCLKCGFVKFIRPQGWHLLHNFALAVLCLLGEHRVFPYLMLACYSFLCVSGYAKYNEALYKEVSKVRSNVGGQSSDHHNRLVPIFSKQQHSPTLLSCSVYSLCPKT